MNKFAQIMNEEVKGRINDHSWDYVIAAKVMSKKRKRRMKFFTLSVSSFAVSTSLVVLLVFGLLHSKIDYTYDAFISQQVSGVGALVFNNSVTTAEAPEVQNFEESLYEGDIDNEIETALLMRL